jgi:hypothetical protein
MSGSTAAAIIKAETNQSFWNKFINFIKEL